LEDKGLIDGNQKAILKDLIISGDEELQAALDKYEQGDTATLENMIRSGELMNRAAADIDLLGDLDLDFLNVDDHFGDIGPPMDQHHTPTFPLQPPPTFPSKDFSYNTADSHPTIVSLHDEEGIGDMPGEFSNEDFLKQAPLAAHDTRFRSNSLAYGPLLNDQHVAADNSDQYGGWMDRHIAETRDGRVGSIGGLSYASADAPSGIGGIAESLAQYAKSKGEAKPMTKAQLAEAKRREKAEKKEQRDREKAEKKEQRDRAKAEKKEREAREKQMKKEKKASTGTAKAGTAKTKVKKEEVEDDDNDKEIPSGLGRPRSMSDPNLTTSIDEYGLLSVDRPDGWVGAYSPESRKMRIERFMEKRNHRVWTKKVKYGVRKNFADSRLRVKGRFVKKEDELLMRDLMSLT
jgi:CCT motif